LKDNEIDLGISSPTAIELQPVSGEPVNTSELTEIYYQGTRPNPILHFSKMVLAEILKLISRINYVISKFGGFSGCGLKNSLFGKNCFQKINFLIEQINPRFYEKDFLPKLILGLPENSRFRIFFVKSSN